MIILSAVSTQIVISSIGNNQHNCKVFYTDYGILSYTAHADPIITIIPIKVGTSQYLYNIIQRLITKRETELNPNYPYFFAFF